MHQMQSTQTLQSRMSETLIYVLRISVFAKQEENMAGTGSGSGPTGEREERLNCGIFFKKRLVKYFNREKRTGIIPDLQSLRHVFFVLFFRTIFYTSFIAQVGKYKTFSLATM